MKHEVLKLKDLNNKIKSEAILRSYIEVISLITSMNFLKEGKENVF